MARHKSLEQLAFQSQLMGVTDPLANPARGLSLPWLIDSKTAT